MWYGLVIGIGALAAIVLLLWLYDRATKAWVLRRMQSRKQRTPEQFGRDFFPPEKAAIAARLREILESIVKLDLARMSPDERLEVDLRMIELDSLSYVEFLEEIEKEFNMSIPDNAAQQIETFRELVDYVAATRGNAEGHKAPGS